jgi:hypothetical protein
MRSKRRIEHTHGAASFSPLDLDALPTRRRRRRLLPAADRYADQIRIFEGNKSGPQKESAGRAEQVWLTGRRLPILLLFGVSGFCDVLAEITGMISVKCLRNRLRKRTMLRIISNHPRPGDRLQANPVAADRKTERQYDDTSTSSGEHPRQATGSRAECQWERRLGLRHASGLMR